MVEALQQAHFTDGADIGSHPALAALAGGVGLDEAAARAHLDRTGGADGVTDDLAEARRLGIDQRADIRHRRKYGITGAQDTVTLLGALDEIAQREAIDADR